DKASWAPSSPFPPKRTRLDPSVEGTAVTLEALDMLCILDNAHQRRQRSRGAVQWKTAVLVLQA
ncbi:hypothetical protein INR49_000592, partial [Caranx melampygus]